MKKIIVGIFSLAMLLGAQHAFASVTWNQASNDCKSISILNATTNVGYANPCWPLSTVQAKAGDVINVRIYYHNTGNETAKNARIMVGAPADTSSTTKSFIGRIVSDNGSLSFGPVTANISSAQTLSFISAKWYTKNTSELLTPLYAGQSGSEVLTDAGLEIGSVPPGWADQGSVVVAFRVSSNSTTQTCQDPNATNYGGTLPCTYPTSTCTILNFTANGASSITVPTGAAVTLVWNTQNCTSSIVSGPNMTSDYRLSGSKTIYPTYSGDYMINAYGDNGTPSKTVSINVSNTAQTCQDPDAMNYGGSLPCTYYNQSNCYINNFTIDGSSTAYINEGESVSLSWDTENCTYVTVSGPNGFYNTSQNNTRTIYPINDGTYTLTARGSNGITRTKEVRVVIDNNNNNNDNCYINNFTANGYTNININSGQQVALAWNTRGCNSVSIPGVGSNLPATYSQFVYPTYSTTYTLNAYGYNSGTRSQTVRVNVNQVVVPPPPVYNVCAVTTVATNVTTTSAQLNGLITNPNGASVNSYFEYGTTVNLGLRTQGRVTNGSFSETISGLNSGSSYFFRAVSDCNNGLSYGKIEVFSTNSNQVVRPIFIQGNTVVGTASPIMLTIENRYQAIGVGDTVDYTVTYKNIGKSILTNPVLQVIVPQGITITNASAGTYSSATNTLTVPLNDLHPGQDGVVYLQGHVDSIPSGTAQIVTTAILVYTNPNGAQENAIAYVLNSPRGLVVVPGNVLGASAFWAGFWNIGLIGWLLLIILILLIILLTRRYNNKSVTHTTTPGGESHTTTTHY